MNGCIIIIMVLVIYEGSCNESNLEKSDFDTI